MYVINKNKIGFTHLYNAMSGNDHRTPGVVTAALRHAEFAEIISFHLYSLFSENPNRLYLK